MSLGNDGEPQAGRVDGALLADAGDDVGERAALGRMIVHVVDGDERGAHARAQFIEPAEPARLVAALAMDAGEKRAAARCRARERAGSAR